MDRLGRMKAMKPLFVDFTWGAGGSTADLTVELTLRAKNEYGLVPNMHLTCTNMPVHKLDDALKRCKVRCYLLYYTSSSNTVLYCTAERRWTKNPV